MNNPEVIVKIEENCLIYLGHSARSGEMLTLANGYKAERKFYEAVIEQAMFVLGGMEPGKYYNAREICGEEFWSKLFGFNRNMAGMCFADAVMNGRIPLVIKAKPAYRTPNKYRVRCANQTH